MTSPLDVGVSLQCRSTGWYRHRGVIHAVVHGQETGIGPRAALIFAVHCSWARVTIKVSTGVMSYR